MKKKIGIIVLILMILLAGTGIYFLVSKDTHEIRTIKSEAELEKIYDGDDSTSREILATIFGTPFSILKNFSYRYDYDYYYPVYETDDLSWNNRKTITINEGYSTISKDTVPIATEATTSGTKDFSTTNIQVENVDEADITKTDGDYIYSISENNVIITDVRNPKEIKIASKISLSEIPEELILNENRLVVITAKSIGSVYAYNGSTVVKIYDITSRENPSLVKHYELNQPYYTSRCINGELYVIASGNMKKDNGKVVRTYNEDNNKKEIALDNIKYLKDVKTRKETLISSINLNNVKEDVNVSSFLMDVSNAYVSENAIYLLEQKYDYGKSYVPPVSSIFGPRGIIGAFIWYDENDYVNDSGYYTQIFKFNISKDGNVDYASNTKIKGKTINQYSLDEYNGHLRIALYDNDGARVAIFDERLNQIGITSYVAKGEKMYSSRFMGNKAYLVTYRNTDPLFVIDLSNETNPQVLGELHIPGYSTYLHPYDETHLIGIGMQTEETVRRNSEGKVISTSAQIVGMKMALFDVSDVNNPKQMSETVIGDRRTTSAILSNPKALLFSKERELIAIPVNNYIEDVDYGEESEEYENSINTYIGYSKPYVGEGYFVYNINLNDGFKLKGTITHVKTTSSKLYYYGTTSKLLRGLYIDENLYTVSETAVKVNNLDTLEQVSEINITN